MNKNSFVFKHVNASADYKLAYDIVSNFEPGDANTYTPDNMKTFRKYLYDLALKQNKEFATRKGLDGFVNVIRLT